MKVYIRVIVLLSFFISFAGVCDVTKEDKMERVIKISGGELRALTVAVKILEGYELSLLDYHITVNTNSDEYIIVFMDKNTKNSQRGSGNSVGVEVHVSTVDFSIMHSQLVR
ncbi:hypothetical protein [Pseudoalteromonas luteoviolacea]|uniref:Uncharacterized protein n=1 Tax=Pseudoalteromonas luteoviolacea S4054 TaxID=1129367 RepID=A0A0F6AEQ2_9GAMM|nr:hypothetical protein [Pseudoalteromonas luteoviolacea]AOT07712.1 hypothetical protein S4054249_07570 [Pseudoalteromonas luteoviolacea]AOT12628.1 hypothetical protein S40542_07570 [Pseudoalteromonas luteoviolacea]AOT17542.1 hypothetical protein S4054_07570 [Pseudoalteromonas luteoviolacea]KKE84680.1 hypothetical protein N479_26505 [Pseudoalteromonas luteoviolacea S4054]KZN74944.1 hypothetical protein N481_26565 [Pseudoalteromonas luteoviolacea S4047-1]